MTGSETKDRLMTEVGTGTCPHAKNLLQKML